MADKWTQYEVNPTKDKWSQYEKNPAVPETSKLESGIRGTIQGMTAGFGDEAQAAIRSVPYVGNSADALLQLLGGSTDPSKGRLGSAWSELTKPTDTYKNLRDEQRNANDKAAQDNPLTYTGGVIAGSLPAAGKLAGLARAAPTTLKAVGTGGGIGAGIGALQGAGNAETMADVPEEVGKGIVTGGVLGAVTGGLSGLHGSGAVSKWAEGAKPPSAAGTPILDNASLPALSALGNIGMNRYQGSGADYRTDFLSALGDDAIAGGKGALAGLAVKKGSQWAGQAADKAAKPLAKGFDKVLSSDTAMGAPLAAFSAYLRGLPDAEQRKKSMELQSTAEGRAKMNTESPLNKEDEEENR